MSCLLRELQQTSHPLGFLGQLVYLKKKKIFKLMVKGFPGGAVVKNPPANAGDTDSIPGPGRSHMPWST